MYAHRHHRRISSPHANKKDDDDDDDEEQKDLARKKPLCINANDVRKEECFILVFC